MGQTPPRRICYANNKLRVEDDGHLHAPPCSE